MDKRDSTLQKSKTCQYITSIKYVLNSFVSFSCRRVYRDNNKEADKASKEGLQMALGLWKIREHRDGSTQEFYHRPFIKWAAFYIFSSSTNNFPYFLAFITGFILHSGLFFSTNNSLQNSLFWIGYYKCVRGNIIFELDSLIIIVM